MPHSAHGFRWNTRSTCTEARDRRVPSPCAPSNRRRELLSQLLDTALHADLRIKGKCLFISGERGLPVLEPVKTNGFELEAEGAGSPVVGTNGGDALFGARHEPARPFAFGLWMRLLDDPVDHVEI